MSRLFSGATDVVDCGSPSSLDDINVFTWCAWIYCTNNTNTRYIMSKRLTLGKALRVEASAVNGGINFLVAMSGTDALAKVTTANTIPQNSWLWICCQFTSGFVATIYTAAPGGTPTEPSYGTHTTGIGSVSSEASGSFLYGGDASASFPGRIGEVKVWNVNLTQGERIAAMQGFPVRMGNLKGYWPSQGQTSSEPDFSGNKNTGTVTGATQAKNPPCRSLFAGYPSWQGAFTAAAGGGGGLPFYMQDDIKSGYFGSKSGGFN